MTRLRSHLLPLRGRLLVAGAALLLGDLCSVCGVGGGGLLSGVSVFYLCVGLIPASLQLQLQYNQ